MKKGVILLFLFLLIISSCNKDEEIIEVDLTNSEIDEIGSKGEKDKVSICHYNDGWIDAVYDGDILIQEGYQGAPYWETINVSGNSLEAHLNHGDVEGECSTFPTDGLIAWYPFNGSTNDESGNGNNGTAMGSVNLSPDRFGNLNSAYSFPGLTNSYISVNHNSSFSNFQEGLTLSVWAKYIYHPLNSRLLEIGNTDGGAKGWTVSANSSINKWVSNIGPGGGGNGLGNPLPSQEIVENTWTHLVLTFNFITGSTQTYIDGVLVGDFTPSNWVNGFGVLDLSDRIFNIGRKTASAYDPWKGSIDDLGIWNRPLTQQEVENLYNSF